MKNLLILFILVLPAVLYGRVEKLHLTEENDEGFFDVGANERWRILDYHESEPALAHIAVWNFYKREAREDGFTTPTIVDLQEAQTQRINFYTDWHYGESGLKLGLSIDPTRQVWGATLFIEVEKIESEISITPQNTIVIPENETGEFRVLLESSVDQITWTAATAGLYGTSTERRFFRIRIIKN